MQQFGNEIDRLNFNYRCKELYEAMDICSKTVDLGMENIVRVTPMGNRFNITERSRINVWKIKKNHFI